MSMDSVDAFVKQIKLSSADQNTVSEILGKVKSNVLDSWLEKLIIKDGKVAGTFYADLGVTLSFSDFTALYKAIGYDMEKISLWQDWWCYGAEGCKRQNGYTCNTSTC